MIREAIITRLKELNISKRKCAIDNEIIYQSFNQFLLGSRPLPLSDIEKVLDYLELRIVKMDKKEKSIKQSE